LFSSPEGAVRAVLTEGEIIDFLKSFGESMGIAVEATPSWYWLYDT
jgi:hypothetical protein